MMTLTLGFVLSCAGALVIYLIGFHRGALRGSEVGCAIARQARVELEQAQAELQKERDTTDAFVGQLLELQGRPR